MYKIRVHLYNEVAFLDKNVFVDIELPAVPRKREILYLSEDSINQLKKKASEKKNNLTKDAYQSFLFEDKIMVRDVVYREGQNVISIELSSL